MLKRYRLPDPCISITWRIVQEPGTHRCDGHVLFLRVVDADYGDEHCVICGFPCVDADINDSLDMNCMKCRPCYFCLYCRVSLPAGCLKRNELKTDDISTAPFAVCLHDLDPDELAHMTAQEGSLHGFSPDEGSCRPEQLGASSIGTSCHTPTITISGSTL